jgi:hypothetical protein
MVYAILSAAKFIDFHLLRKREYMVKRNLREFPWYVILFAIYPVLNLLANNIGEVEYAVAYRALIISTIVSVLFVPAFYLLVRNWKKAGVLTVLWLLAFFLYGHVFGYVKGLEINNTVVGRHTYFMVVWLILFIGLSWLLLKSSWQAALTPVLSTMSIVLVVFSIYQLVLYQYNISNKQNPFPEIPIPAQTARTPPDIYFIILDMYGRNDVLTEEFNYDDSSFLGQLRDMGFYVASCSQSNYPSTAYSLSATLNTNYLEGEPFTLENTDPTLLWYLIQNSAVETTLRKYGYKVVAFETGYEWTEWQDADQYFSLESAKINGFEDLLLRNSFLAILSEKGYLKKYFLSSYQRKYDLSLYVLDELEKVPALSGPKFVFAHLTIPHPPFVVGPNGEFEVVPPRYKNGEDYYIKEEYQLGYQNQLAFLNMRLVPIFQSILKNSSQPPIIIVQGDHGPRFVDIEKQVDILNAYYFPGAQPKLYPSITPVNNFRLVFNTYFGASLPYLPDKSYVPNFGKLFDFREIQNDCVTEDN